MAPSPLAFSQRPSAGGWKTWVRQARLFGDLVAHRVISLRCGTLSLWVLAQPVDATQAL